MLIKRIAFSIIIVLFLSSCGTSKAKSYSKKKGKVTVTKKPVHKPIVKKIPKNPEELDLIIIDLEVKTEILVATSTIKVTAQMVLEYIAQYKDIAKENMSLYGVPASIKLAQGILESGAGTGALSKSANNHFGIKCHKEWSGPSVKHDDDAPQECFRKYEKPNESYNDHSLFLKSRAWYNPLFELPKDDYKAWAKGLKKSGYATDPKYPSKLIGLIERYQLQQYDSEVLGTTFIVKKDPEIVKETVVNPDDYIVSQGDTLYSISKKFNISVEDLKKKNNLVDNALTLGQSLKVK
jgi:flagellum-specific peptidoglycan hydrolase FlgJ